METYTDANMNTVLTPNREARSPLQVWYPFTLPTELPTEGSMEPEQKDRETNRARQNVLGIHTGTEFILWHSL